MIADSIQNVDLSMCYTPPNTKSSYDISPMKQKPFDADRLIGQMTRNRERTHERTLLEMDDDILGDGNFTSSWNKNDNKFPKIHENLSSYDDCGSHHEDLKSSFTDLKSRYLGTNNPIVSGFGASFTDHVTGLNYNSFAEYERSVRDFPVSGNTLIKEQIKKLDPNAIVPIRGTKFSACKDLFSPIDAVVPAGKNLLIKTNIAIAWDNPNYYMQLLSRSGLAFKYNVVVQAGVIDFDYRANIGVLLQNNSDKDFVVKRSDRIAQYAYVKINTEEVEEVEEFTIPLESDRKGGFGSTGK